MLKGFFGTLAMIRECIVMSFSNIVHNKVRSFLTMLGIMIGVTAVIALITTVNGFSTSLTSTFSNMGAGTMTVTVTGSDLKPGLNAEDLQTLTELECVDGITPSVTINRARVSHGGSYETGISVGGKNSYYFAITEDLMERGRQLNIIDENNKSFVCLIDQKMIDDFYFGVDPVGTRIVINGLPYTVVGIFDSSAAKANLASLFTGSPDILIPYTTALKVNGANVVTSFTVYLTEGMDSEKASDLVGEALDPMFSYEEDCYTITTMASIEETMQTMLGMVSTLLAGIASIALVVGGIGIMNMMLTTVTERTTEIGLKKALGAVPWQIQMQFLIESFMLSMIGGLIGVGIGLLLSLIMCKMMNMDFALSVEAIILGVGFSAAVGIFFGWAPARKASGLNPIDALRSV